MRTHISSASGIYLFCGKKLQCGLMLQISSSLRTKATEEWLESVLGFGKSISRFGKLQIIHIAVIIPVPQLSNVLTNKQT